MLSVREIKARLDQRGIRYDGVLEKSELMRLLDKNTIFSSSSSSTSSSIAMSVSDLREIIRSLAGRTGQCAEKMDLFLLAKDLLSAKRCEICLDSLLTCVSETVVKTCCCTSPVFLHQHCWAEWAFKAAQEGIYPHKCPVCGAIIDENFLLRKIITPQNPLYLRYISTVENLKALQSGRTGQSLTKEEESKFARAGFKKCPTCGVWIEKGPALEAFGIPVAAGCDKMTCRCGCKFCFNCGALHARCNCTGPEHGFFDHSEVMADYPRSHLEGNFFLSGLY